ncbi:hypothetical protein [Komagataeibacter europaeus]|nr:hypothetical protein [Komagataeibacter europaeus]
MSRIINCDSGWENNIAIRPGSPSACSGHAGMMAISAPCPAMKPVFSCL